jgi:hypothetical protein
MREPTPKEGRTALFAEWRVPGLDAQKLYAAFRAWCGGTRSAPSEHVSPPVDVVLPGEILLMEPAAAVVFRTLPRVRHCSAKRRPLVPAYKRRARDRACRSGGFFLQNREKLLQALRECSVRSAFKP